MKMLREVVSVHELAITACAGGETPHFLLGLGLRKCWTVVALLFVIFGVAFATSASLLTPSSCRAAVSLLSVQTSVFPRLPAAGPRARLLQDLPGGIAACAVPAALC